MKAFRYTLHSFGIPKISLKVFEAEEKRRYYEVYKEKSPLVRRVDKRDIAIVSGDNHDTVWLLENDFERAKEIFSCYLDSKCEDLRNSIMKKEAAIERNMWNKEFIDKLDAPESEGK